MTNLPTRTVSGASMMMDPQGFEQMYRVGRMLASSILFPEHLRKGTPEQAAANGALVMNMALRLNEDPLTVAQNIYFVGGKPGWSSSYMIGKANQHGVFKGTIGWDVKGQGADLSVTAFATLKDTGERVQATCDMAMAKAEGWTKNAKYQSMPEQMLRYRSATFLIRLYCPEVMVGIPAQIEVELGGSEMRDVTPREYSHAKVTPDDNAPDAAAEDAEVTEEEEPSKEKQTAKPATTAKAGSGEKAGAEEQDPREPAFDAGWQGLYKMILDDMADASSVDEVLELYGQQIGQMKALFPAKHEELQAEIKAFREAAAKGDEAS